MRLDDTINVAKPAGRARREPRASIESVLYCLFASIALVTFTSCESTTTPGANSNHSSNATSEPHRSIVSSGSNTTENHPQHHIQGQPVSATLTLPRNELKAGETIDLSIKLEIAPLWEIRSLDASPPAPATELTLDLPPGLEAVGEWQAPKPQHSSMPDGHEAYSGEVVFHRQIKASLNTEAGEKQIKSRIRYQACNDRQCLAPTAIDLVVPLRVD